MGFLLVALLALGLGGLAYMCYNANAKDYGDFTSFPKKEDSSVRKDDNTAVPASNATDCIESQTTEEVVPIAVDEPEDYSDYFKDCDSLEVEVKGIFARSMKAKEAINDVFYQGDITLRREPSNPYDPFAVKVMYGKYHIGYVPKENSKFVTELIHKKRIEDVLVLSKGNLASRFDDPDPYMDIIIYYKKKA